jgi:hypothetical protein
MQCPDHTRRSLLLTALAADARLAGKSARSEDDKPGSDERPRNGDLLVVSEGEHQGAVLKPDDLKLGALPARAWPKDSKTSVVSTGSRLKEILVIGLDPGEFDEETRRRCADGIVAHSGVCSYADCSAAGWLKAEQSDKDIHKGFCHNSKFNPRKSAQVAFGPSAGAVGDSGWLAHSSCNVHWKGRCSTTTVTGRGRIGFPCPPDDRTTHHGVGGEKTTGR